MACGTLSHKKLMTQHNYGIIGGGIAGLIAAYALKEKRPTLFERGKNFGGIIQSMPWQNMSVDFGCHIIDNTHPDVTKLMFALSDNSLQAVDIEYNSYFLGKISPVLTPDLTNCALEIQEKILKQTLEIVKSDKDQNNKNLQDYLDNRWGRIAGQYLKQAVYKITKNHAEGLDACNISYLPLARIRILDDEFIKPLKEQNPLIDERLAVYMPQNSTENLKITTNILNHKWLYPKINGIGDFTTNAIKVLQAHSIHLQNQTLIEKIICHDQSIELQYGNNKTHFKNIYWCNMLSDLERLLLQKDRLKSLEDSCGMLLVYFKLPKQAINPLSCLQNYDHDFLLYRYAAAGIYSNQIDDEGNSYICLEVTMRKEDYDSANIDALKARLWEECQKLNLVHSKAPLASHHIYAPSAIKLYRAGHAKQAHEVAEEITKISGGRIKFLTPRLFLRTQIALDILSNLGMLTDE